MELRLFILACVMYVFYKATKKMIQKNILTAHFSGWHAMYLLLILHGALYLLLFVMSGGPGGIFPWGKFSLGSVAIIGYTIYDFITHRHLEKAKQEPLIKSALDWCNTVYFAGFVASIVMFFFLQAFKIPSASMRDTLLEGDHLFVNKMAYGLKIPFIQKRLWEKSDRKRGASL